MFVQPGGGQMSERGGYQISTIRHFAFTPRISLDNVAAIASRQTPIIQGWLFSGVLSDTECLPKVSLVIAASPGWIH